jgi:hypothetical protein
MRDDVETVGWRGQEFGGRRAAVEYVGHLLPVTDASVTALRHPFTPRRETTRARGGDERKRSQEEEEAMG